jgi:hypothetical protein
MGRSLATVSLLVGVAACASLVAPAYGAFPGQNGKIAFVDYADQISAIYPNGVGLQLIARDGSRSAFDPSWSPDGAKVAYTSYLDEEPAYVMTRNADGGGAASLGLGQEPVWSPDGTKILFMNNGALWTMNADGTGRSAIPNTPTTAHNPSWSPDGSKIAFVQFLRIYTINPDGTGATPLTSGPNDHSPNWSPDGSKLVFTRQNGPSYAVWQMNADGTGQAQLVSNASGASWSPDGTKIAYAGSGSSLHVVNPDGTADRTVIDEFVGGSTDWQPCPAACGPPAAPYDVPAQAFRLTVSLVPNFRQTISSSQCQARGGAPSTHGAPLALGSCNPPGYVPGTAAHLSSAASPGSSVRYLVSWGDGTSANGNQADVYVNGNLYDLRTPGGAPYDPDPGFPGDDITIVTKLRLTDTSSGLSQTDPATVMDFEVSIPGRCDPSFSRPGSDCWVGSSLNAVTPGAVTEAKKSVLQVFRARVNDSGPNGTRGDGDDRTFATQGIAIP